MSQDDNEEIPQEDTKVLPWIPAFEAFQRFGKSAPELKALAKAKKIRSKTINSRIFYSTEDLEELDESDDADKTNMADLVRAARDMLTQVQKHHETMFEKYMASFDKLLGSHATQADKQNEHILNLEKQAIEMREAAEKVFNLEHTRKMDELKEERTRAMQGKALDMLQKTLGPWLAQRLGGAVPGVQATSDTPDARFAQLGQAIVGAVVNMSDEQFAKLGEVLGPDELAVLQMIREGAKQS